MHSIGAPEFVHFVKAVVLAETAEEVIIQGVVFIDVETAALLPHFSMPENRWLGEGVVATFPDGEVFKVARIKGRMLNADINRILSGEKAAADDYVAIAVGINLMGDTPQTARIQWVGRI